MCNIAGYIGNRPATRISINMLRQEEGFDSGNFTIIHLIKVPDAI